MGHVQLSEDLRLLFLPKLCNCPVSNLIAFGWQVSIRVQVSEDKDGIFLLSFLQVSVDLT